MINLLFILLLITGCTPETLNHDHCDIFSEYSEECAEIKEDCEETESSYTIIDNNDYENNSACCCVYD